MTKKQYWKGLSARQKRELAGSVGRSAEYLRQVFVYGRHTGAELARSLASEIGGSVGAHEFCPGAFSESDQLDIKSDDNAA